MWSGLFHQNKIVNVDASFYLHLVQVCVESRVCSSAEKSIAQCQPE
jgi:hypothetical protein